MRQPSERKRPWLAALLSSLVTGLGHLYLGRWRRALGWLVVVTGVGLFLVDPTAIASLAAGSVPDPVALGPLFVVSLLSVLDAYILARAQNVMQRVSNTVEGARTHCPNCGNELDPELSFCHWCSTEIDRSTESQPDPITERT
ncbi:MULTISPECIES: zinc ribbon domain-containing protein [unclassified Halorhabdus]|uniref:zinc ribbon domain-containing protein n=1 Tax=unclassified Halorhabdus TaxID=2621901 RepID=UPI0023DA7560|nr:MULTISPECIES: zinc ribbon domain-containing protein [unclassified Halorhabdus]WEL16840.1 Membrane protein containing Zn-ribbon domain [Halorhabdus sp. SVX81]WEL20714.1 Membrane protein containing Zn-ribbon domain [Halorhabdus sp. BNX81]